MYGIAIPDGLVLVEGGWGPTFGARNGFRKVIEFKTEKAAQKYIKDKCFEDLKANVVYLR